MTVNDICDELAAAIEPDPTQRDDACAEPSTFEAGLLYVWPMEETYTRAGTRGVDAAEDDVELIVGVGWASDRAGESEHRIREVSDEIADRALSMAQAIRRRPTGTTYYDARLAAVDHRAVISADVRGFKAIVATKRLRTDV